MEPIAAGVAPCRDATQLLQERRVREATFVAEELARRRPDPRAPHELARVYFDAGWRRRRSSGSGGSWAPTR